MSLPVPLPRFISHRPVRSAVTACALVVLLAAPTSYLRATAPAWWNEQGVIPPGATADNHAIANVGQLKNLAAKAAAEFEEKLAPWGGAGSEINDMVEAWSDNLPDPNNFTILNQGQLKTVAKKFYDRLAELGYQHRHLEPGESYPWTTLNTADNDHHAPVVLGQLKHVFSFISVRPFGSVPGVPDADGDGLSDTDESGLATDPQLIDSDGDGIPDGWEVFFGSNPLSADNGLTDSDGDHLGDLMEFLLRSRPNRNDQDLSPKLAAGGGQLLHTLETGVLQAWGDNRYGQSGVAGDVPTVIQRAVVSGAPADVVEIASGLSHAIALTKTGLVYTWGDNEFGQLGDGTRTSRPSPGQVTGLTRVVQVAAGDGHSLALDGNGVVWAWGANHRGQSAAGGYAPLQVTGLEHIVRIAAGARHSVALDVTGNIWVWGDNGFGQLAISTPASSATPLLVGVGAVTFGQIAAGRHHVLALDTNGTAWAWGANFAGQLGNNDATGSPVPVQVISWSNLKRIAAGGQHSLAITATNGLVAWGANEHGQLGLGSGDLTDHDEPVVVPSVTNVERVAAGHAHSVVLRLDASLLAWGDNTDSRLGVGLSTTPVSSPATVLPPE